MATVTGQRTTGNVAANQRIIDLSEKVLRLEPDASPLCVITKRLSKSQTTNVTFRWAETERTTRFDAVNNGAGYNTTDTSIVVDTGTLFSANDLVKVPRTGEVFSVTSVSTNTLTVVRGNGTGTGVAIVDNDPLYIIGKAEEEGGTAATARAVDPTFVENYTEIFKRSVEISGSAGSEVQWTSPHDWQLQHEGEAIEHMVDIENAFLFGKPASVTLDSKPARYTGGALHFATQNGVSAGGTLTEAGFETFLRGAFRYGSNNKTLFASPLLVSVLNNFSQTKLQTDVGDNTYGVSVSKWISPHGTVNIVKHNLLEGATWGGYGILLDLGRGNVKYRYLAGGPLGSRDTKLYRNRQAPDRDGQLDEWITECGLQFGQSKTHGVLSGVTG